MNLFNGLWLSPTTDRGTTMRSIDIKPHGHGNFYKQFTNLSTCIGFAIAVGFFLIYFGDFDLATKVLVYKASFLLVSAILPINYALFLNSKKIYGEFSNGFELFNLLTFVAVSLGGVFLTIDASDIHSIFGNWTMILCLFVFFSVIIGTLCMNYCYDRSYQERCLAALKIEFLAINKRLVVKESEFSRAFMLDAEAYIQDITDITRLRSELQDLKNVEAALKVLRSRRKPTEL
jgi:hypothetical protein